MSTNPTESLINCELIAEAGETDTVVMILTVRTADGLELKHSYPIPSGYEACTTQWNEALGAIHAALEAKGPLLLNSPPAVYNGAHIASVEFSFVGAAKIIERINNAHRGMGFATGQRQLRSWFHEHDGLCNTAPFLALSHQIHYSDAR